MKRVMCALAALTAFAVAGYSFYFFGLAGYGESTSSWLVFGPSAGLIVLGCVFLVVALSHDVTSGYIVAHLFTPAHMAPPTAVPVSAAGVASVVPGHWVGDRWSLRIEGEHGRKAWVHFDTNVFDHYPVGAYYKGFD